MAIRGWIYVLINPGHEGLVKVGFSTKDPALRVRELSSTGVPQSFEIAFEALVENPREVEQLTHSRLKYAHESKEFFRVNPSVAVKTIREVAAELDLELHMERIGIDIPPEGPQCELPLSTPSVVRRLTPGSIGGKRDTDTTLRRKTRIKEHEVKSLPSSCPHCGSHVRPSPSGYCASCFGSYRSES